MQAAPRDALISDLAPDGSRSACFGFAQSMRKWGSAVGAVMVYFLMKVSIRPSQGKDAGLDLFVASA